MGTRTHDETIVDALTKLARANRDSEEGYTTAAEAVRESDADLHTLFHRYAQQRAHFAGELEQEIHTYGGEYPVEGSISGTLRKGWLNLRSAISGHDSHAIVAECLKAENATLEDYEEALRQDLPEYLKEMIREQHDDLLETRQRLQAIKQAT
ncbi:MAG: PA2169 family four-helix-bundle protein [Armatimonadia bacterium]